MKTVVDKKLVGEKLVYSVDKAKSSKTLIVDFVAKPKNLADLRKHMAAKLQKFYPNGTFLFSLKAIDNEPFLLISSDEKKGIDVNYQTLVHGKKPEIVYLFGSFTCDKAKGNYVFTFYNPDTLRGNNAELCAFDIDAYKRLIKEYTTNAATLRKVATAFWNSFMSSEVLPSSIALQDKSTGKKWILPEPEDAEFENLLEYNLVRLLTAKRGAGVSKTEPLAGSPGESSKKGPGFRTTNGLFIPDSANLALKVTGRIARDSAETSLLKQALSAGIPEILQPLVDAFKKEVLELDASLGDPGLTEAERKQTKKAFLAALEKLGDDFANQGLQKVTQNWVEHRQMKEARFSYEIDMTSSVAFNGAAVVGGAAAAVGSGGILLALEISIVARRAVALFADIYKMNRELPQLFEMLNRQLIYHASGYLNNQTGQTWKDLFAQFGDALYLTQGINVLDDVLGGKGKAKSLKELKGDINAFGGKLWSLYKQADQAKADAETLMEQIKQAESIGPIKTDKKAQADVAALGLLATESLENAAALGKSYVKYKERLDTYLKMIEGLEKLRNEDTTVAVLRELLIPAFKAVKGLRPGDLVTTVGKVKEGVTAVFYEGSGLISFLTQDTLPNSKDLKALNEHKEALRDTLADLAS